MTLSHQQGECVRACVRVGLCVSRACCCSHLGTWGCAPAGGVGGVRSDSWALYLFAHGVDPIGPQERHCLLHQVRSPTVQHPETQVLLKLGFDGHCVQLSRSTKAIVGPKEGRDDQLVAAASPGTGPGGPGELESTKDPLHFPRQWPVPRLQLK